jgi:hypothetical protein
MLAKHFSLLGELTSLRDLIDPAVSVADKKPTAAESIGHRSRSFTPTTPWSLSYFCMSRIVIDGRAAIYAASDCFGVQSIQWSKLAAKY